MKKIVLLFFLSIHSLAAFCQSIPQLDSLLNIPGLYIVAYPDDGPKDVLKGLKPVFCKDKTVITTFLNAMELKADTSCTGNAYYNYIINFASDSIRMNKYVGLSFNDSYRKDHAIMNPGNDTYYSFNPKAVSYLKSNAIPVKKEVFIIQTSQEARSFHRFLEQTPETYFYSDIRNDVYTKYNGAVLLQFEYPETLSFEEGEKYIQDKIKQFSSSTDYYYHLREANWNKPGFTTEKILLHINQENLLPAAASYTIQPWYSYGPITFTIYSNRIKAIEAYLKQAK